MEAPPLVVLVGFRAGIMRAAERLGVELAVVNRKLPPQELRGRLAFAIECQWNGPPDALVASVEGALGERKVAAVLALTEGAVVPAAHLRSALGAKGSSVATAERCSHKRAMKDAVGVAGIPCADYRAVDPDTDPRELVAALGLPMVLKHACSSGSRGLLIARSVDEVRDGLVDHDLAESFVEGVEMSVEGFLVDGEVAFLSTTRYLVPFHANVVPSGVAAETEQALRDLFRRATSALGLRTGVAHMEVFLAPDRIVFGELAARPPGGRLMPLIQRAWGFDPYEALLRIALNRAPQFPTKPRCAAGTWILHPGPGVLDVIEGQEAARSVPGITKLKLRVRAGDRIATRLGSGQDIGHMDARASTPEEVSTALLTARDALCFELCRDQSA